MKQTIDNQYNLYLFTLEPLFLLPLFGDFARFRRISTTEPGAVQSCRRIGPGTRRISRSNESSKGLNTESNNPQCSTATVLVGLAGGEHCREETLGITQVQGPLVEVKPLRSAWLYCLWRFSVQRELVELWVAAMAKTLDLRLLPSVELSLQLAGNRTLCTGVLPLLL